MKKHIVATALILGLAGPAFAQGPEPSPARARTPIHKRVGHAIGRGMLKGVAFTAAAGLRIVAGSKSDPGPIKMGVAAAKKAGKYYDDSNPVR